ncbi:hypothetical protein [Anabaena sp. AL93]|uniref:hypothetical protein n=1 Tax=Anabaena sp. AL93 TaxID=1678133 RepID=UPI000A3F4BAC|nr:hypothetical protein [Anabaena sp. AL93]
MYYINLVLKLLPYLNQYLCDRSLFFSSFMFFASSWFVKKGYWEVEGMRSLFGGLKGAIAVWGVEGCDLSLCVLCVSVVR